MKQIVKPGRVEREIVVEGLEQVGSGMDGSERSVSWTQAPSSTGTGSVEGKVVSANVRNEFLKKGERILRAISVVWECENRPRIKGEAYWKSLGCFNSTVLQRPNIE